MCEDEKTKDESGVAVCKADVRGARKGSTTRVTPWTMEQADTSGGCDAKESDEMTVVGVDNVQGSLARYYDTTGSWVQSGLGSTTRLPPKGTERD